MINISQHKAQNWYPVVGWIAPFASSKLQAPASKAAWIRIKVTEQAPIHETLKLSNKGRFFHTFVRRPSNLFICVVVRISSKVSISPAHLRKQKYANWKGDELIVWWVFGGWVGFGTHMGHWRGTRACAGVTRGHNLWRINTNARGYLQQIQITPGHAKQAWQGLDLTFPDKSLQKP